MAHSCLFSVDELAGDLCHALAEMRGGLKVASDRREVGDSSFDWAMAPIHPPTRFRSSADRPGNRSSPTQIMALCAANSTIVISEFSLSPCMAPELVKPAAILLRHFWATKASLVEASMKAFSRAEIVPL
jgi:hypothetical protein